MPPQKAPPRRKPTAPRKPPAAAPPADPLAFVTEHHEPNGPATVRLRLRVLEQEVPLAFVVPGAPTRPRRLLPALHQLSTLLTEAAVAREAAAGREISCRKGCGACCRQLVPITEPECLRLRELVEALPEPQRGAVLARFADAKERLQAAGVLTDLEDLQARAHLESPAVAGSPAATADEAQEAFWRLAMRYVAAQVPCPFLVDESCSIHRERPLVCREFLVTSPAERCAEIPPTRVDRVPLPGKVSAALGRVQQALEPGAVPGGATTSPWVPLVLALDYAHSHRDRAALRPGPDLLRALLQELL